MSKNREYGQGVHSHGGGKRNVKRVVLGGRQKKIAENGQGGGRGGGFDR